MGLAKAKELSAGLVPAIEAVCGPIPEVADPRTTHDVATFVAATLVLTGFVLAFKAPSFVTDALVALITEAGAERDAPVAKVATTKGNPNLN